MTSVYYCNGCIPQYVHALLGFFVLGLRIDKVLMVPISLCIAFWDHWTAYQVQNQSATDASESGLNEREHVVRAVNDQVFFISTYLDYHIQ